MPPRRLEPWILVSAAWIGPAILGALDAVVQRQLWGGQPLEVGAVLFASLDWLLYALFTPFVFALSRRWPLSRERLAGHGAIHLVFSLLFCVAWAGIGTLLKAIFQPEAFQEGLGRYVASWLFTTLPFGVAVYLAVVGIEHAIRYFAEARERAAHVAELSAKLATAQLAALEARLNPHFLFNSLNTVNVLVRDGERGAATRVIEQLCDVLRRTLDRTAAPKVALADELELVRQYLAVEEARFSDRLRAELRVAPELLGAALPPFALQHLVENAIRHGISRRTDAGRLVVSARRDGDMLELVVEDDGAGLDPDVAPPRGHGIENTRERLRALYGARASLELSPRQPTGAVARLRLPWGTP